MRAGELAMAPCGWLRSDGTGNLLVLLLQKEAPGGGGTPADAMRTEGDWFSLSVVNPCGEGVRYHALRPDPATGNVQHLPGE
jgi:hypothetical protein